VNVIVIWLPHEGRNKQRVLIHSDLRGSFGLLKFVIFRQSRIYLNMSCIVKESVWERRPV